jgi:predicted RNase H-like HicB family nuclease
MRFVVYIEVEEDGSAMAHVPALPGCVSTGLSQEIALARLPQSITDYYRWLKAHGEQVPDQIDPIELEVAGVSADAGHPGDAASFFPSDRSALSEQEVATLLRLMTYSRRDLLELVTGLGPEVMAWKARTEDEKEAWDIDDILEHIAGAERFYTTRLSTDVLGMLQESRTAAMERLSHLSEGEMSRVVEHAGELWSARKVFRRLLEHEREHVRHVQQVLDRFRATQGLL